MAQDPFGGSLGASTSTKPNANPLDDLLGLFDNHGLGGGQLSSGNLSQAPQAGIIDFTSPSTSINSAQQQQKRDVDLLADLF